MTMIARLHDGLPLAATMQDDEQVCFFICFNALKVYVDYVL